jgi:hypothetical protein
MYRTKPIVIRCVKFHLMCNVMKKISNEKMGRLNVKIVIYLNSNLCMISNKSKIMFEIMLKTYINVFFKMFS